MKQVHNENHPAVLALKDFFFDMHGWEVEMINYNEKVDSGEITVEAEVKAFFHRQREKLKGIFRKYVDVGEQATRFDSFLNSSSEPIYDQDREQIVSVNEQVPNKVIVETIQTHAYHYKIMYTLIRTGDRWFVRDNRKYSLNFETKWKSYPL